MKNLALALGCWLLLLTASTTSAQTPSRLNPTKEHKWLRQFVGKWDTTTKAPPMESKGEETVRPVGEFWIVAEHHSDFQGTPITSNFTLGYDPEKQKFVATWIDSMFNYLWTYDGTLDAEGKTLTFLTEGPNPMTGKPCKFKEELKFEGPDRRVHTSWMQGDDGEWSEMMTIAYQRKQ